MPAWIVAITSRGRKDKLRQRRRATYVVEADDEAGARLVACTRHFVRFPGAVVASITVEPGSPYWARPFPFQPEQEES